MRSGVLGRLDGRVTRDKQIVVIFVSISCLQWVPCIRIDTGVGTMRPGYCFFFFSVCGAIFVSRVLLRVSIGVAEKSVHVTAASYRATVVVCNRVRANKSLNEALAAIFDDRGQCGTFLRLSIPVI